MRENIHNLEQTLAEIKEIAGRIKETCEEDEGRYSCACDYKKQILQKISEYEVIDE
jgi:hypothetical protein